MEVDRRDVVECDLPHDADAERAEARPRRVEVVGLEDHHVAPVTTPLVEQAARGRPLAHRRDDLEKRRPDRHHRVVEAELADAGIMEGDL